jgi:hypothetical protein
VNVSEVKWRASMALWINASIRTATCITRKEGDKSILYRLAKIPPGAH